MNDEAGNENIGDQAEVSHGGAEQPVSGERGTPTPAQGSGAEGRTAGTNPVRRAPVYWEGDTEPPEAVDTPEGTINTEHPVYAEGDTPRNGRGRGGGDGGGNGGPPRPPVRAATGPWGQRMAFFSTVDGLMYPYVAGQVLTTDGPTAARIARRVFAGGESGIHLDDNTVGPPEVQFYRLVGVPDPLLLIHVLNGHKIHAQVNHGYFAHSLQGNPVYGNPVYGNPVYGNPVYGNPVYGNPVYGNSAYGGGMGGVSGMPQVAGFGFPPAPNVAYGTELFGDKSNGTVHEEPNRSSALPKPPRFDPGAIRERINTPELPDSPEVFVLDTGLSIRKHRPHAFHGTGIRAAGPHDYDAPSTSSSNDHYLEPTAGHGTFIAGVITQIAPGCRVRVHKVLSTFGDGDEWTIADHINHLDPKHPQRAILNCSFGGYVLDEPLLMKTTIRHIQDKGVLVVASAGNDASSMPSYPAGLNDVLAVGALSPTGPAYFTNWGPWVDACAPGYDVLSAFFRDWNGPAPKGPTGEDPDDFSDGWAVWSGTSFACPVVVGNLVRLMMADGATNKEAVDRLINNFSLTVIPNLGTIVDFL